MRSVIQRVLNASVIINGEIYSGIQKGMLVLLGIEDNDGWEDVEWLAGKIYRLRIFDDDAGIMNLSLADLGAEILVVSQFTLFGSTKKGNRPSYIRASKPETAIPLYEKFVDYFRQISRLEVKTGLFGADMKIELVNDGPVTLFIDTKSRE